MTEDECDNRFNELYISKFCQSIIKKMQTELDDPNDIDYFKYLKKIIIM